MAPDLVLADILYLTLAAAQRLWVEGGKPMVLVPPDCGFAVHWLMLVKASDEPAPRQHDPASLEWPFSDLSASVDAIVAKPSYATLVEAVAAGCPVVPIDV